MKDHQFYLKFILPLILCFLILIGCSPPIVKMPKTLPPIVKEFKHITLQGNNPGMVDTGIHLIPGDVFTILATGSIDFCPGGTCDYHNVTPDLGWPLMLRIGQTPYLRPFWKSNTATGNSTFSGNMYFGIRKGDVDNYGEPLNPRLYQYSSGYFSVDIIVWEKEDYVQIADFLEEMKERDPNNKAIIETLEEVGKLKEVQMASQEASKEIEETKQEIKALKKEPEKEKEQVAKPLPEKRPPLLTKPSKTEIEKQEKVSQLEAKLTKLMETFAKLEEMKKKFEEERKKSTLLAQELEKKEKTEKDLLGKLEQSKKTPPVIVIASPKDESKVEVNIITFSGVAEDDDGLVRLEIFINNKPIKKNRAERGIRVMEERTPKHLDFRERISLERGVNKIKIHAVDTDGLSSEKILTVHKVERRKNMWAVVIGINNYPKIRQLKYAVNDARIIYSHLVNFNHIPAENVTLLLDQEATLTRLRSALGTHLKNKAGKDDMVIIFFAGHGATEKDVMSPDGDGLEKYLLPYDADPKDLYATALPMVEVSRIFNRIRSERLIFIADSCYSGASGGRTIGITGIRANISEAYLDRIARGKGGSS